MSLEEIKKLKPAETKEEQKYNEKRFSKAVGKMTRNVFKFTKSPTDFLTDFDLLMQEGVRIKVLTQEQADKHKTKLYDELAKPSQFKEDVRKTFERAKSKVNKRLRKK